MKGYRCASERGSATKSASVGEHEAKVAVAGMELRRGQYEGGREVLEEALKDKGLSEWYRMTLEHELNHQ